MLSNPVVYWGSATFAFACEMALAVVLLVAVALLFAGQAVIEFGDTG